MRFFSKPVRQFFPFALGVAAAAAAGRSLTELSVHGWYARLVKPAWTPPDRWFGPVWTCLYAAMALAAWRVLRKDGWESAQGPLRLWGMQLVLNAFWPGFFFALRRPGLGAIEILVLLAFVLATAAAFWKRDRPAGLAMLPYCLWTAYATALNIAIWRMNP